ncbi:UNKNOWN [Stylonychia lemnae]|uniref:Uncharacterized protein n=1 Tax=Stylonychia lemnae TaxID=5949 RepID=A0A078AAH3_STYLE|nr:UNKNOWN [Stylonychia lemnae]|eukprot:CDW77793.1 UNKNOWN [Stylonychia lemnae]
MMGTDQTLKNYQQHSTHKYLIFRFINNSQLNLQSPRVEAVSIWKDSPFTSTQYYQYAQAIQTGLALKYTSSAVCFQNTYSLLNDLFYLHQNITGYTISSVAYSNGVRQVSMVSFNVSNIISRNFANTFSNCYTMTANFQSQTAVWLDSFVDFSDVYTSFLFNLLSQSLKIRSLSTNIQTSQTSKDWVTFSKSIAQLFSIIFDFESSNAANLDGLKFEDIYNTMMFASKESNVELSQKEVQSMKKMIVYSAGILQTLFPSMKQPLKENENYQKIIQFANEADQFLQEQSLNAQKFMDGYEERMQENNQKRVAQKGRSLLQVLANPDMTFHLADVLYIGFGVVEGAMSAVPTSVFNYQCGKNVTQSRLYFAAAVQDFSQQKTDSAVANMYKILQSVDDITINCVLGVQTSANTDVTKLFTSDGVLTNILYNAGFMFTDVLDIIRYDDSDTNPYWYYVFYRVGDFLIRFVYRDTTLT